MENRFYEKQQFIMINLLDIKKAYESTSHKSEIQFNYYEDKESFNIIVVVTVMGEDHEFKIHPDDHVKRINKKLKDICKIALI